MSAKTKEAVMRAALRRYRQCKTRYDMSDAAADAIRACHAHAKSKGKWR